MAKRPIEMSPFVQALQVNALYKLQPIEKEQGGLKLAVRIVDIDDRCAVYTDGLLAWFKELGTATKDMVLWIAMRLPYEQDYLEMSEEKYCREMDVSRSTFYACRNQLVNRLIAPRTTRKNTCWVNPAYLYKGSRTKMFKEQVKFGNENPLSKLGAPVEGEGRSDN